MKQARREHLDFRRRVLHVPKLRRRAEKRDELSKWGNNLRQTFRTIAQAVGVPELDVHLLMHHSIRGVKAGYITRNKLLRDHLWSQQEAISRKIVEAMQLRRQNGASALWIDIRVGDSRAMRATQTTRILPPSNH